MRIMSKSELIFKLKSLKYKLTRVYQIHRTYGKYISYNVDDLITDHSHATAQLLFNCDFYQIGDGDFTNVLSTLSEEQLYKFCIIYETLLELRRISTFDLDHLTLTLIKLKPELNLDIPKHMLLRVNVCKKLEYHDLTN